MKRLKIGTNRGQRRIWIEGSILTDAGFTKGLRYDRRVEGSGIYLSLHPNGKYKVAGTDSRPIIDITGQWLTEWAQGIDAVNVNVYPSLKIELTPEYWGY